MNYDDFPILSNSDYELLKQKFTAATPNRNDALKKICTLLNSISTCNITTKLNNKISSTLKNIKQISIKQFNNFSSLFNLTSASNQVDSLSVFLLLKKILLTSNELVLLSQQEEKLYYKKLYINSSIELIISATEIISSMEDSFVMLFNHM